MSFVFPTHSLAGGTDFNDFSDESFTSATSQLTIGSRLSTFSHSPLSDTLPRHPICDEIDLGMAPSAHHGRRKDKRTRFHRRMISCFSCFHLSRPRENKANRVVPSPIQNYDVPDQQNCQNSRMDRAGSTPVRTPGGTEFVRSRESESRKNIGISPREIAHPNAKNFETGAKPNSRFDDITDEKGPELLRTDDSDRLITTDELKMLSGVWKRDRERSEDYTPMCEMLQLGWVFKKAMDLSDILQFEVNEERIRQVARIVKIIDIVEEFPLSGEEVVLRRRDLRRGPLKARTVKTPTGYRNSLYWGAPLPGGMEEEFKFSSNGKEMVAIVRVYLNTGESCKFRVFWCKAE